MVIIYSFFLFLASALPIATDEPGVLVQNILDQLIQARGEIRSDYPTIRITNRIKNIASYSPVNNEILIERKAFDICFTLGDRKEDALAFLISHELTHFFQRKDWNQNQGSMAFYANKSEWQSLKHAESEADKYGAFLAYLAGFEYYEVAPKVIELLYDAYGVSIKETTNYPTAAERVALTEEVCGLVREYTMLFEVANTLQQLGEYDWSQSLYKYLLKYLDLTELYSNAGVNQLKAVLAMRTTQFVYPLELIHQLSLREALSQHPKELLTQARENLIIACEKNPGNHESFIILASIEIELGQLEKANDILEQLELVHPSEILKEKMVILRLAMLEDTETKKLGLIELMSSTKHNVISENCKNNLKLLTKSSNYETPMFPFSKNNKSFYGVPKINTTLLQKRLIDLSDPLFPLSIEFNPTGAKFCKLTKGKNEIEIWIEEGKEQESEMQNSSNTQKSPENFFVKIELSNAFDKKEKVAYVRMKKQ